MDWSDSQLIHSYSLHYKLFVVNTKWIQNLNWHIWEKKRKYYFNLYCTNTNKLTFLTVKYVLYKIRFIISFHDFAAPYLLTTTQYYHIINYVSSSVTIFLSHVKTHWCSCFRHTLLQHHRPNTRVSMLQLMKQYIFWEMKQFHQQLLNK